MMRVLLFLLLSRSVFAELWCGKQYKRDQPLSPVVWANFPLPQKTTTPQLALRCHPSLMPFLPDDLTDTSSNLIIVDALVRYEEIAGAQPLNLPWSPDAELSVTVSIDGIPLTSGTVQLNGSAVIPFSLSSLSPRSEPYSLTCSATLSSPETVQLNGSTATQFSLISPLWEPTCPATLTPEQNFTSTSTGLTYLPSPPDYIGSITKLDLRTGGLLAKRAHTQDPYEPIFPVGFFTQFDNHLEGNDSILEVLRSQGFNAVHPIPPYGDLAAFDRMVDKMEQLGLWLIYDMRWSYMNATSVTEQATSIRNRTNLLVYYTADEPDGNENPHWAPDAAATLINTLDPYRPSSLCLNCQDYLFAQYAAGTPILQVDVYPISIDPNHSVMHNTPCTIDQGCCGCDNCVGDFEDIRNRIDEFHMRFEALGWERIKTIWTAPQAFGNEWHWSSTPTYEEFLVQVIVAVNAGVQGAVAWTDPTTPGIKAAASQFASALPELTPFLLSSPLSAPPVRYAHVVTTRHDRLDFGVWVSSEGKALVMAANLNYFPVSVSLDEVLSATPFRGLDLGTARLVVDGGARIEGTQVTFPGSVLSGAWIFE